QTRELGVSLLPGSPVAKSQVDEVIHSLSLSRLRRTQRSPEVSGSRGVNVRRKHAYDFVGLACQRDRLAQHILVTVERPLPELIAEHDRIRTLWPVFIFVEFPAHQ